MRETVAAIFHILALARDVALVEAAQPVENTIAKSIDEKAAENKRADLINFVHGA